MTVKLERAVAFRQYRQGLTWWILPTSLVIGWADPSWGYLGLILPACVMAAMIIAPIKGRKWCDWMCPRGAFFDVVLGRRKTRGTIPAWLRSGLFRWTVFAIMMAVVAMRIPATWPNPLATARVFLLMLTVTTSVGLALGLIGHQRTWCSFCPGGTMGRWLRNRTEKLHLDEKSCTSCGRCESVCPMQLHDVDGEVRIVSESDCLKCGLCVQACPKHAIEIGLA